MQLEVNHLGRVAADGAVLLLPRPLLARESTKQTTRYLATLENNALAGARAKGIAAPSRREDNGCGVFRRVPEVRRRRGDYV